LVSFFLHTLQWLAAAEAAFSLEIAHIDDDAHVPALKVTKQQIAARNDKLLHETTNCCAKQ
jgi:hypothetical protein